MTGLNKGAARCHRQLDDSDRIDRNGRDGQWRNRMQCIVLLSLMAATASATVHWSFESDALALGGKPGVSGGGEMPVYVNEVCAPQIWDGATYAPVQEKNQRSLYFKPVAVNSLAPAGGEIAFDGTQKELKLPTLTVEAFVRVEKQQKMFALIASKRRSNGSSWSMSVSPEGVYSVRLDTQPGATGAGFNHTISSGVIISDGLWHHVAMSFDHESCVCTLYVDYEMCKSSTVGGPLVYDDTFFTIGCGLNGWIDEMRISDKVLHPEHFLRRTQFFSESLARKRPLNPGVMLDLTPTRVQTEVDLEWKKIGTLKPKEVAEIPGDFWSLGCETLDRDLADWDLYKGYLKPLGIKRIRLQGGWNKTEKKKGEYDFAWLDHIVDSAHDLGLKVCLETSYGNRLYDPKAGLGPGGLLPSGDEELRAWDAWVEAMVRRYQPRGVEEWMMYNEPNLRKENSVDQIVAFNARTADVIKRVDPDAKIAGLVCSGLNLGLMEGWIKGLKESDKLKNFEWVIYHGYSGNPDALNAGMRKAKAMVRSYAPDLKLWQGEAGCASEEVQFALSGIDWTELSHAKWNARRMLCDFAHEIESTVFTISDLSYHKDFISRYGLLKTNPDNSLSKVKSAYYVVNNIVSVFNDAVRVNQECRFEIESEHTLTRFAFKDKASGYDLLALWDGSSLPVDPCNVSLATVKVLDLKMDRAVWVDLLTGRIYEIPAESLSREGAITVIREVPYFDAPVLLTDLSVLSYVEARISKKKAAKKVAPKSLVKMEPVPMQDFRLFGSQKPAPAVIIWPADASAGGWSCELAEWLRGQEIHAFVLSRREQSLKDAVAYVRSQAAQWQVDPVQIGVLGPALGDYKAADADFAVVAEEKTGESADTNLMLPGAVNTAAPFDGAAAWSRELIEWLEPRKTKVF